MIEEYVAEFERWIPGDCPDRAEWATELLVHLRDAEAAGDLHDAVERLGTPREAARSFLGDRPRPIAPSRQRLLAGLVDYGPLLLVSLMFGAFNIASDAGRAAFSVPATFDWNGAHSLTANIVFNVVLALAVLWTIVGLGLFDLRSGQTPGKALTGVRVVSTDGTALDARQAFTRRLSVLVGPALVIDLLVLLVGPRHQRALDHLLHTMVVAEHAPAKQSAARFAGPSTVRP